MRERLRSNRNLLVIPQEDLESPGHNDRSDAPKNHLPQQSRSSSSSASAGATTRKKPPRLLLLQLPTSDWTATDLLEARFVVQRRGKSSTACLVIEEGAKASSFALHRMETSNALVLLPPSPAEESEKDHGHRLPHVSDEENKDEPTTPSSHKRPRLSSSRPTSPSTSALTVQPARVLQGGSGASFLHLKPHPLKPADVYQRLREKGPQSLSQLALHLCQPRGHLQRALLSSPLSQVAVLLPPAEQEEPIYGLWPADLKRAVYHAWIATLLEESSCLEYGADDWRAPENLVELVRERLETGPRYRQHACHWIRACIGDWTTRPGDQRIVQMAQAVVRYYPLLEELSSQENQTLLSRWQTRMPGTGDAYTINPLRALKGLAVLATPEESDTEEAEERWISLDVETCLETTPHAMVDRLWGTCPTWTRVQLQPYWEHYQRWWGDTTDPMDVVLRPYVLMTTAPDGTVLYHTKQRHLNKSAKQSL